MEKSKCCNILEVSSTASQAEIRNAWKLKIRKVHTDRNKAKNAIQTFMEVQSALEYLTGQAQTPPPPEPKEEPQSKHQNEPTERHHHLDPSMGYPQGFPPKRKAPPTPLMEDHSPRPHKQRKRRPEPTNPRFVRVQSKTQISMSKLLHQPLSEKDRWPGGVHCFRRDCDEDFGFICYRIGYDERHLSAFLRCSGKQAGERTKDEGMAKNVARVRQMNGRTQWSLV